MTSTTVVVDGVSEEGANSDPEDAQGLSSPDDGLGTGTSPESPGGRHSSNDRPAEAEPPSQKTEWVDNFFSTSEPVVLDNFERFVSHTFPDTVSEARCVIAMKSVERRYQAGTPVGQREEVWVEQMVRALEAIVVTFLKDTALEPVRVSDRCKREVCNQVFRARLRIATRVVPNPATLFAGVRQDIYRNLADSSVFYQFFMSNEYLEVRQPVETPAPSPAPTPANSPGDHPHGHTSHGHGHGAAPAIPKWKSWLLCCSRGAPSRGAGRPPHADAVQPPPLDRPLSRRRRRRPAETRSGL